VKKRLENLPTTSEYLREKFSKEEPINKQEVRTIIENELLLNDKEDSEEEIYEEVNGAATKHVEISSNPENQIEKTTDYKERKDEDN